MSYLNQRRASVPIIKEFIFSEKKIRMENTGVSLSSIKDDINLDMKIDIAIRIITIVKNIFLYGVSHFDVALRNLTLLKECSKEEYKLSLIDFGIAVSREFPLQKPLWILPNKSSQHILLSDALKKDWSDFFLFFDKAFPLHFYERFDVSRYDYENYWTNGLYVEKISVPLSIITHSLSLTLEDLFFQERMYCKKIKLFDNTRLLKNLRNDSVASESLEDISELFLKTKKAKLNIWETPIPRLEKKESLLKKMTRTNLNNLKIIFDQWNLVFISKLIAYMIVDNMYKTENLRLSDSEYYIGLFCFFCAVISVYSNIKRKKKLFFISNVLLDVGLMYFSYKLLEKGVDGFELITLVVLVFFSFRANLSFKP